MIYPDQTSNAGTTLTMPMMRLLPPPDSNIDEIHLKQVEFSSSRFHNTQSFHRLILFFSSVTRFTRQKHVLLSNWSDCPEEEEASSVESAVLPEEVKARL